MNTSSDFFSGRCNSYYLQYPANAQADKETADSYKNIYLFGFFCPFQHCTGHIMTASLKGRGTQYIKLVKVLYCKLLAKGKPLSYLRSGGDSNSDIRDGM